MKSTGKSGSSKSDTVRRERLLLEKLKRELARRNLVDFTCYTYRQYHVGWHHRVLCDALRKFASGEITRLMVFMPPRHGKSELVSRRLPAWLLGQNPDLRIIAASYGATLARDMNRDVQRIVDSTSFHALFPDCRMPRSHTKDTVQGTWVRNADEFDIVGHRGGYKCAGVGGGITGRGFDVGIIDDPVKDRAEADSPTFREKVWDWYSSTFWTRQEGDQARILLTMTRWHEDDLAGRLLEQAKDEDGEKWQVIWFPAVREQEPPRELLENPGVTLIGQEADLREVGQGLWTEKYAQRWYDALPGRITRRDFTALYQNRPSAEEGNIIKRAWLNVFERDGEYLVAADGTRVDPANLHRFQTVDLATSTKQTADYTVIASFGGDPGTGHLFLLDLLRERLDGGRHGPAIRSQRLRNRATYTLIEKAGFQLDLIQRLRKTGEPVRELMPDSDKVSRAYAAAPLMEGGHVHIPERAAWLDDLVREMLGFPNAPHDDQVDAVVYGCLHWQNMRGGQGMLSSVATVWHERIPAGTLTGARTGNDPDALRERLKRHKAARNDRTQRPSTP